MVTHLLESGARRRRSLRGALPSIGLHAALIAGAIHATAHAALRSLDVRPVIDTVVFVPSHKPPAVRVRPPSRTGPRSAAPNFSRRIELAPPKVDAPAFEVAAIDMGRLALTSPRDFGRGLVLGSGVSSTGSGDGPAVRGADEVDVPAEPLGAQTPPYPESLRAAGVVGQVAMQFVVDTAGAVEAGSIRVIRSTNELFSSAVRSALRSARFRPAESGDRKVRQRVQQTFTFVLH